MRALLTLLLLFGAVLSSQAQPLLLKGTVVGREVGWETDTLVTWLSVADQNPVKVEIYSPGFDPRDYRAALRGVEELGDERYDGGKGEVRATFRLEAPGQGVLKEAQFGVEPHRWVTFWEGPLSPGVYLLSARFEGLGKNAFVYRITGARTLLDGILLVDLSALGTTLRQVGEKRGQWTEVLRVEAPDPVQLEFYDEDGPEELRSLVVYSDDQGKELFREERPVSSELEWVTYALRQGGLVRFFFTQPPMAKQYSNTFAFRFPQGCLEALPDRFKVLPPGEAKIQVVDPTGRPLDLPLEQKKRRFALSLPPGYKMVRLETKGAVKVLSETSVEVGCPGGEVRFVVEPPVLSQKGNTEGSLLQVEARILLPDGRTLPAQVGLGIGEKEGKFEGEARFELSPGTYPLAWKTPGLEPLEPLPKRVELRPGEKKSLLVTFRPLVSLSLEPEVQEVRKGEEGRLFLRATTPYPGLLPGELSLELPEGLRPLGPDRVSGPLGGGRSLELELPFVGEAGGAYVVKGRLMPYGLESVGRVRVFLPASLRLEKEALVPEVPIGGVARFRITATNEGDEPLEAVLVDRFLDQTERLEVRLEPRKGRSFELEFPIPETAKGILVNRVEVEKGPQKLSAEASVRVLRPEPRLVRTQEWRAYLPGEVVVATLKVRNDGEAPLSYRLSDRCPDGFTPLEPASFEGLVPPGEERVHTYRLRVEFGPETEGVCQAELISPVGTLHAESPIARRLLKLEKEAVPGRILEGGKGTYRLKVENPVDHPVEVQLLDIPDRELAASLDLKELPASIRLEAKEAWSFEVPFTAPKPGRYRNTLQAKMGDALVAFPVEAYVESLPILLPERISTVHLQYEAEGPSGVLLLAHKPPEGGSYVPGSARKDGLPLEDPRVLDGLLIWRLPFPGGKAKGEVTYALRHTQALPPLEEPRLTLVNLDRATPLKGKPLDLRDYERAKPIEGERGGFIKEPKDGAILGERARASIKAPLGPIEVLLNGKPVPKELLGEAQYDEGLGLQVLNYYGLPLEVGRNVLEVTTPSGYDRVEVYRPGAPEKVVVEPVRLVADGHTPIELRIKAVDKAGLPTGFGFVTVEVSPEPIQADASPLEPGYQVLLKDGVGTLLLFPLPTPREVSIRYRFNEIQGSVALSPKGPTQTLWLAQASLTLGRDSSGFYLQGLGRAYAEGPLLGGSFQGALDTTGDLSRVPEGSILTGAGSEAKRPLSSDDPVAFRWTGENLSLSYERGPLAFGLPEATALRLKTLGPIEAEAFLGLLPLGSVREEITPDGGSSYPLRFRPK